MNYGNAEIEIVQRLNNHFTGIGLGESFIAKVMPETEEEAKEFEKLYPKSRVAVEHIQSEYQKSSSLNLVKQNETITFRLLMEAKRLRGEKGLYRMMEEIKLSLLGFRLSNTDEMIIAGQGKQQYESGVWLPYIDFECQCVNVQAFDPSQAAIGGPLTSITAT